MITCAALIWGFKMKQTEITPEEMRTRPSHAGRNVLVTGSARGIGRATAEAFLARGATVAICDLNAESVACAVAELNASGCSGRAIGMPLDVSDYAALDAAISASGVSFDTVVNNAGISPKHDGKAHRIWELDPEEWRRVIDINLTGCFNTCRALTPGMRAAGKGWIVNVSSIAGKTYSPIVACHYAATKSALIGFTKHLAAELGPNNIRVNAVAPGRIATPMVAAVAAETNEDQVRQTPLARLGQPAEVADAIVWLTSSESSFVTGQTIDVAGGLMMT